MCLKHLLEYASIARGWLCRIHVNPRRILKIFSNIYFKFEISFSKKKTGISTTIRSGACDICLFFFISYNLRYILLGLELMVFMDSCHNKPKNKKSKRDQCFNVFLFCSCVHQAYTEISTYIFVYAHVLLSILLKVFSKCFVANQEALPHPPKRGPLWIKSRLN